jgi:D-alanine-D-alanine ligase-like ATP-grasp enzyme
MSSHLGIHWFVDDHQRPLSFCRLRIEELDFDSDNSALIKSVILDGLPEYLYSPVAESEDITLECALSYLALQLSSEIPSFFEGRYSVFHDDAERGVIQFPCVDIFMARQAGFLITRLVRDLRAKFSAGLAINVPQVKAVLERIKTIASRLRPRITVTKVLHESFSRGVPLSRSVYPTPIYHIGQGRHRRRFMRGFTERTSHIGTVLSTHKKLTSSILSTAGVPVPRQKAVRDFSQARALANELKYPVVVKPVSTDKGLGVTVDIKNVDELKAAFEAAKQYGEVILEEHVHGEDFRFLVINGEVVGVTKRLPARLIGDGESTVRELFDQMMDTRKKDPFLRDFMKLSLDDTEVHNELHRQRMNPNSVPTFGSVVTLRSNANVSSGGSHEVVTELAHKDNIALAIQAVDVIGLDIAGVDYISPDISRSWKDGFGAICEINPTPALSVPHAERKIIDDYLEEHPSPRIPIVVVMKNARHSGNNAGPFLDYFPSASNYVTVDDDGLNVEAVDLKLHSGSRIARAVIFVLSLSAIRKFGFSEDRIAIFAADDLQKAKESVQQERLLPLTTRTTLLQVDIFSSPGEAASKILRLLDDIEL